MKRMEAEGGTLCTEKETADVKSRNRGRLTAIQLHHIVGSIPAT